MYLAKVLNQHGIDGLRLGQGPDFKYKHLGSMASVGEWKGVVDTSNAGEYCGEYTVYSK